MIRSILWKETRQHGATFVVLTLGSFLVMLGAIGLLALDGGINRPQVLGMMGALIVLLSMVTSILTGALLTGTDNEEKTRPWLDSLPGDAWKRWLTQVAFALAAQAAMIAIWGIVCLSIFWNDLERGTPLWSIIISGALWAMAVTSGVAWGQWGGYRSRSVFGGFGAGLVGLVLACISYFLFQGLLLFINKTFEFRSLGGHSDLRELALGGSFFFLAIFFGVLLPFGLVANSFHRSSLRLSLGQLSWLRALTRWSWLSYRTTWGPLLGLFVLATILGLLLQSSFLIWPAWGVLVGVVFGLGILGPDQDGEKSFHGSLRAFRPWQFDLRVLPALLKSLPLLVLPLIPITLTLIFEEVFLARHNGYAERRLAEVAWEGVGTLFPIGAWLFIWWSAGFGAAMWTGLFFDKWIVSLVVSLGLGALISTVWVPSLWGQDLSVLWPLGVVAVFWVLSRYLYRSYCSATLAARGLSAFAIMFVSIGLFLGLGLVSRFLFVPNPPAPFDIHALAKTLHNPDGHLVDEVMRHLPNRARTVSIYQDLRENGEIVYSPNIDKPVSQWENKEKEFFRNSYQKIRTEFTEKWTVPEEIFSLFVAQNSNFSEPTVVSLLHFDQQCYDIIRLRLLHAVWQLDNGQQADFSGEMERAFYVCACIRHKGNRYYVGASRTLESFAFKILEDYLAQGKPQEKTLAELAGVLDRHKKRLTKVELIPEQVAYYISLKSLDNPRFAMDPMAGAYAYNRPANQRLYWDLFNLAMKAPWEEERKRRLINMWYSGDMDSSYFPHSKDSARDLNNPVPFWWLSSYPGNRAETQLHAQDDEHRGKTAIDLARIAVAAKRYQLANKAFPKALADLAPKYLAEIPKDSFTGAEFRFRIAEATKAPNAKDKKTPAEAAPSAALPTPAAAGSSPGGSGPEDFGPAGAGMGMIMGGAGSDAIVLDGLSFMRGGEMMTLKPGTLVIWSIGPDGTDQGGKEDRGGHRIPPNLPYATDDMCFLVGP